MDPFTDFLQEFFIQPIVNPGVPGYNMVNTLTYGIILLGIAFYVIFPLLHRKKIQFDFSFMKSLIPYILFGISMRVLEDQHILTRSINPLDAGFYTYTPGIWIATFGLVLIGMALGKIGEKKWAISREKIMQGFGYLIALPFLAWNLSLATEWGGFFTILLVAGTISAIVFWIGKKWKWAFLENPLAKVAFFGQILDTSATFTALELFSCGEQHVIPRLLFSSYGNSIFFLVKIPLILLVLFFLHRELSNEKDVKEMALYGFILIFLCILGLATGGRDTLTVLAGTCTP